MFEIKPIQNKEEQKGICESCGVEYDADCLAYSAKENGAKLLGVAQFRVFDGYGVICDLANAIGVEDLEVLIIMGKAALNFMDSCGAAKAVMQTNNLNLPEILGFKEEAGGIYKINLEGYFNSPCT